MSTPGSVHTPEAKPHDPRRAALEHVLNSQTFARADQLKRFLRYVCEMELEGRGSEITEYFIGTEALGRPSSYAPWEDSTVRTSARALRQKLAAYYETEMPEAELRIEIPKGMYTPRFVEWRASQASPSAVEEAEEERLVAAATDGAETTGAAATGRARTGRSRAAIVLAAVLLVALGAVLGRWWFPRAGAGVDPLVREAWAPVTGPGPAVMLCISSPVQMMIRSVPENVAPEGAFPFPQSLDPFRPVFENWQGRREAPYLFLEPSAVSTTMGETFAAMRAVQVLQSLGSDFKPVATRSLQIPAVESTRAIVVGGAEYSKTTRRLLERGAYQIRYDAGRREQVLVMRNPAGGEWERTIERRGGSIIGSFGLVTVLANDSGRPATAIGMTGLSSAGIQAAMEFFGSASSLARLKQEMAKSGITRFPHAYQVVVRCTAYEDQVLSYSYEAHKVLDEGARGTTAH